MGQETGTYIIRFSNSGMLYIGSTDDFQRRKCEHLGSLNKGIHCNRHLQNLYSEDTNIVFDFFPAEDRDAAYRKEQELINENLGTGQLLNVRKTVDFRTSETNQKIRDSLIGHFVSDESRKKMGESKKGNKFWVGKNHREETKKKLSEAHKGNSYAKGHVKTPEGIEKIRQANLGKKLSDATKFSMSVNSSASKCVMVNGVTYRSLTEAAKSVGVSGDTIRRRCLSDDECYQFN